MPPLYAAPRREMSGVESRGDHIVSGHTYRHELRTLRITDCHHLHVLSDTLDSALQRLVTIGSVAGRSPPTKTAVLRNDKGTAKPCEQGLGVLDPLDVNDIGG